MQFPGRILSLSCMSWILLPSSARALVLEPPSRARKGAPQVRGMPVIVLTGRSAQADLYLINRSYRELSGSLGLDIANFGPGARSSGGSILLD